MDGGREGGREEAFLKFQKNFVFLFLKKFFNYLPFWTNCCSLGFFGFAADKWYWYEWSRVLGFRFKHENAFFVIALSVFFVLLFRIIYSTTQQNKLFWIVHSYMNDYFAFHFSGSRKVFVLSVNFDFFVFVRLIIRNVFYFRLPS